MEEIVLQGTATMLAQLHLHVTITVTQKHVNQIGNADGSTTKLRMKMFNYLSNIKSKWAGCIFHLPLDFPFYFVT